MKYLVLGLFSLALLGFVCAQNLSSLSVTVPTNNSTSNMTGTASNNTTANYNNISTGTNPINTQNSGTTTRKPGSRPTVSTADGTVTSTMTTKSGQGHILTSVSLLLGSFALHALWQ